jgi:hypothetical protein
MALGDYFIEEIQTNKGKLKVTPLAVEPIADIAVLGALDDQEFLEEVKKIHRFCEEIKPISLCQNEFKLFEPFDVYIYTHTGTWITGNAQLFFPGAEKLLIHFDEQIEPGTSGSPVINDNSELVGIVSHTSFDNAGDTDGLIPRPHLTMPVWLYKRYFLIEGGDKEI